MSRSGEFRFLRPDGRGIPDVPVLETPLDELTDADEAADGIEAWLTEAGVGADWKAHHPEWDGGRLDLDWAIDVLWSSRSLSGHEDVN